MNTARSERGNILLIVLIVVVVLIILGGGLFLLFSKSKQNQTEPVVSSQSTAPVSAVTPSPVASPASPGTTSNPFDTQSTYQNPFDSTPNPFSNLQ